MNATFDKNDPKTVGLSDMQKLQHSVVKQGSSIVEQIESNINAIDCMDLKDQFRIGDSIKIEQKNAAVCIERLKKFRFRIGVAGSQSSGKSMVLNSLLDYPLAITCTMCTTSAAVSFSYGEYPALYIYDINSDLPSKVIDCRDMTAGLWDILLNYVFELNKIKPIENLMYFYPANVDYVTDKSQLELDPGDPRQVAMLLLAALTVFISLEMEPELFKKKEAMYKALGLDAGKEYNIEVMWPNDFLKQGLVIVDLPGLGAFNTGVSLNGRNLRNHDVIAIDALSSNNSLVDALLIVSEHNLTGAIDAPVKSMISKYRILSDSNDAARIIPIISKCDQITSVGQVVNMFANQLSVLGVKKSPDEIFAYMAIACEYKFLSAGIGSKEEVLKRSVTYRTKPYGKPTEDDLKALYERSNIARLKNYLSTKFLERVRFLVIRDAVTTTKRLVKTFERRINSLIKTCEDAKKFNITFAAELKTNIRDAYSTPINDAMQKIYDSFSESAHNTDDDIGDKTIGTISNKVNTVIPELMEKECEKSLVNYAAQLKDTADLFKTNIAKTEADLSLPENIAIYDMLIDKADHFEIDNSKVLMEFERILDNIRNHLGMLTNIYYQALYDADRQTKKEFDRLTAELKENPGLRDNDEARALIDAITHISSNISGSINGITNDYSTITEIIRSTQDNISRDVVKFIEKTGNDIKNLAVKTVRRFIFVSDRWFTSKMILQLRGNLTTFTNQVTEALLYAVAGELNMKTLTSIFSEPKSLYQFFDKIEMLKKAGSEDKNLDLISLGKDNLIVNAVAWSNTLRAKMNESCNDLLKECDKIVDSIVAIYEISAEKLEKLLETLKKERELIKELCTEYDSDVPAQYLDLRSTAAEWVEFNEDTDEFFSELGTFEIPDSEDTENSGGKLNG